MSRLICLFVIAAMLCSASHVIARTVQEVAGFEPRFVCPPGTTIKNIKTDFGAVGDGKTDDTAAFLKAFGGDEPRSIYVPAGTYLIKDQLRYGVDAKKKKRVWLIGESQSSTVLKLAEAAPGFGDARKPKPFVWTLHPKQQGEQNMHMYIYHLTVEIGPRNPGAIALQYHSNNTGAIKDVTLRATDPVNHRGHTGLACADWEVGPANARFLTVEGFNTGVALTKIGNYFTMEHITVKNCAVGVQGGTSSIRDLRTFDCELGVRSAGQVVLLDSELAGTGPAAVQVTGGSLNARNVKVKGFAAALAGQSSMTALDHYVSTPVASNWPTTEQTPRGLQLPVEISPEVQYPQSSEQWTVLPSGDITDVLQEAIDAGSEDILLQSGSTISRTIHLRKSVRRLMGAGVATIRYKTAEAPVFRIDDGDAPVVTLELLYSDYGSSKDAITIEHASKRTVVFRHGSGSYRSLPEAQGAKVFVESVVGHPFHFTKVNAWVRDIDTEQGGPDHANIINDGGVVWILGHKTEDFSTKIKMVNNSFTELLGGTYRQNWDQKDFDKAGITPENLPPLFVLDESHASLTYHSWGPAKAYQHLVRETRGGETRNLTRATAGGSAALFVGYSQGSPDRGGLKTPNGNP